LRVVRLLTIWILIKNATY